jgi:hypothetical protein
MNDIQWTNLEDEYLKLAGVCSDHAAEISSLMIQLQRANLDVARTKAKLGACEEKLAEQEKTLNAIARFIDIAGLTASIAETACDMEK